MLLRVHLALNVSEKLAEFRPMSSISVTPIGYNGDVLNTDHLHRLTTDLRGIAGAGVDGLDPETLCAVALEARRLRELADHLEVHALGALEPTGHTESICG